MSILEKLGQRVEQLSSRQWVLLVGLLALLGAALRVVVIGVTEGGNDLRIYYYFGQLVARGLNPYEAPDSGSVSPNFADNPPLEQLVFGGLIALHEAPEVLRGFFVASDVVLCLVVGLYFPRPRAWRLAFVSFYALNPFVLEAWTATSEDKTVLFLLITLVILGLESGRDALTWIATAFLGALKWLSAVFLIPLVAHFLQQRHFRWPLVGLGLLAVLLGASYAIYLPDALDAFSGRQDRIGIDPPTHASPTRFLHELDLYSPLVARIATPVALAAVYVAYVLKRISIVAAIVLSLAAAYVFLPDHAYTRVLLVTLPFFFIVRLDPLRWLAIWAVTLFMSLVLYIEERGTPLLDGSVGEALQRLAGD